MLLKFQAVLMSTLAVKLNYTLSLIAPEFQNEGGCVNTGRTARLTSVSQYVHLSLVVYHLKISLFIKTLLPAVVLVWIFESVDSYRDNQHL